jgi:thiol-disulfide isomerase/thioredoxin
LETKQWVRKEEFENKILKSPGPELVLFAADWCSYCKRFLGVISDYHESDSSTGASRYFVNVVNIDSGDGSLWETYKVDLVPTLMVFSKGKQVFRRDAKPMIGLRQSDLEDAMKTLIADSSSSKSIGKP